MAKVTTKVDALLPGDVIDTSDFNTSNEPEGWYWSPCSAHWGTHLVDGETCECERRNGLVRFEARDGHHEAQYCFRVAFSYVEEESGRVFAVGETSSVLGERGYIWPHGDVEIVVHRSVRAGN
jgi:hypothetical protein